ERVPDSAFDWKPHEKSLSMQDLASHLANLPSWVSVTVEHDSIDMAPPDGSEPPRQVAAESTAQAVETFDANVSTARAILEAASDEKLMETWSLLNGGEVMFAMPKVAVLRSFIMNHMIHHRAQLTVYLRMNDVPLPALYGPSADEQE
ncbi:MAG: damage-inducible protein DinB, partial [Gemmatimonadetes bacterium]|nr:damage-inducible protein DinB [Gemmatimonadota bacterium]